GSRVSIRTPAPLFVKFETSVGVTRTFSLMDCSSVRHDMRADALLWLTRCYPRGSGDLPRDGRDLPFEGMCGDASRLAHASNPANTMGEQAVVLAMTSNASVRGHCASEFLTLPRSSPVQRPERHRQFADSSQFSFLMSCHCFLSRK